MTEVSAAAEARYILHAAVVGIVVAVIALCAYVFYYDVNNLARIALVFALVGAATYGVIRLPHLWRSARRTGRYSIPFPGDTAETKDWVIEITYRYSCHTFDVDYVGSIEKRQDVFCQLDPFRGEEVMLVAHSAVMELGSSSGLQDVAARRLPD